MAAVTVKTRIDEKTYKKLVKIRRAEGLPSVSALFLDKCGLLTDEKQAREIARLALVRARDKDSGEEFRLRDLFSDEIWARFPVGARLRAGKMFHERVGAAIDGIRVGRKSASNHQFYEKS